MHDAVIVSGARTPVGRFGGAFKDVSTSELGAIAIRAALQRAGISPSQVDEVVIGNALQAAEAGYAARLATLKAGIPEETPTIAVNRQCSSGLEAINMAAQLIRTGEADIVVDGRQAAVVETGAVIGEIALIVDKPRSATVRARTALNMASVSRDAFHTLVTHLPGVKAAMNEVLKSHIEPASENRTPTDDPLPTSA